jgi:hypothetical protein
MKIWKVSSRTIKAFHGTCEKYYDMIEYSGLKDPYLCKYRTIAEYYAEEASTNYRCGDPIILAVNIPDVNNLRYDRNSMEEPIMFESEAKQTMERVSQEHPEWVSNGFLFVPETEWEISWNAVGAVKYIGTIPIENIEVVQ